MLSILFGNALFDYKPEIFTTSVLKLQPRSQGLSSYRSRPPWSCKMRDHGNEGVEIDAQFPKKGLKKCSS